MCIRYSIYFLLSMGASALQWILSALFIGLGIMLLVEGIREGSVSRDKTIAMLIIFTFNVLFWCFFEQAGSSFSFLSDKIVDRDLGGFIWPNAWFQSVNSIAIITLAPVLAFAGARNLLEVSDVGNDLGSMRKMFDRFEQKTQLMSLVDGSSRAEGVRIYIGGESQVVPFQELSVVTAPYEVDGQVVGTLGVIGPQRMPYDRMIQIVDVTSKLVGNALSHPKGS